MSSPAAKRARGLGLTLGAALLASGPALACGAGGESSPAFAGVQSRNAQVAAAVSALARTIARELAAVPAAQTTVSVANVSVKPDRVSMSVDVSVKSSDHGWWQIRRFVVIPIDSKLAIADPSAMAVSVAGVVGRVLVEEIAARAAAQSPALGSQLELAGTRLGQMVAADFN